MKRIFTSILFTMLCTVANAQMLEQIDLSYLPGTANTYVTGLNTKGYITGYFNSGGNDTGFIITDRGSIFKIPGSALPGTFTDAKVESINDHGVAVITANNGATVGIFKAYVDEEADAIAGYVAVGGLTQPSSVAFDISNKNDISGWFQSSTRFLFVKHDSIVPLGNIPFESDRFETAGPTYYNTFAGGVNDANKVSGFYIDGSAYEPFIYDNLNDVFTSLAITERTKLWDINNSGWVAGEYQTGGVWTAFIANASTGSFSQFTSLASIFEVTTPAIQSVANAINDNGAVGGSFIHPVTGKWTGFVYFPEVTEYRIPAFDFENSTWKMTNSAGGPNGVWTPGYWQGTDYMSEDPYANNGVPLMDANIMYTHQITSIQNNMNPKWVTFATEFDANQTGLNPDPGVQNTYKTIIKPKMFDVWYNFVKPGGFLGDCYGFTYTALLRHFYDNMFSAWYDIPAGTNISLIDNSDHNAIDAVERVLSKQLDPTNKLISSVNISTWSGLYRLKCTYRKDYYSSDPRGFKFTATGFGGTWHSVLPYKIRTPKILPMDNAKDTMFIYDSNYPDSTNYIAFKNSVMYPISVPIQSTNYTVTGFSFSDVGIRFMSTEEYSELNKSTSGNLVYNPKTTIGLFRYSDYSMKYNGNTVAELSGTTYDHDSLEVSPFYRLNGDPVPYQHIVDSNKLFDITTGNYTDDAMVWIQLNGPRSMGLSRAALQAETDHSSQKTGLITYGNPDNTTKYLTGFMRENSDDLQQGVNITARNICAEQGDSIVTKTPSSYVYNITKVNGSSTCTYVLDVYAVHDGDVVEFHAPVDIGPNTSHTIDPYYVGNNGTQVVVIVDNGLDGTPDDTLFVTGWPVNLNAPIQDDKIKVYPNPVSDKLNIELAGIYGEYEIRLTDAVGKIVYMTNSKNGKLDISMNQYPTGMYILQITDAKGHTLYLDKITKQ